MAIHSVFRQIAKAQSLFEERTPCRVTPFDGYVGPNMVSGRLTRSIHIHASEAFTCIQAFGTSKSVWRAAMGKKLVRAGYRRCWTLNDEPGFNLG